MIHVILLSVIGLAFYGKKSRKIQTFAFFVLTLMASIRYMYGNDYSSYYKWHQRIHAGWESPFDGEILYTLLNKITPSFYILIVLTSIAFVWTIYKFMTDNLEKEYVWVALLIFLINPYLFLMNLSSIRQCIAMCLYIVAVQYALKKNKIGYIFIMIIAILFHKSAVLLLPTYFLMGTRKVTKKTIAVICVGIIGMFFWVDIDGIAKSLVSIFDDVNYVSYIESGMSNSLRATMLSSVSLIYVLFNLPKMDGKYLAYGKLYLVSTVLAVLAYRMSMLTRIQMYFDIFSVVVIPYLLSKNKMDGKVTLYSRNIIKTIWGIVNKYLLPILIFIIYILRYYSFFTNPMWEAFTEYKTIFNLF